VLIRFRNKLFNVDVVGVLRGKYLSPAFALKIGETAIRNSLRHQLKYLRDESLEYTGEHPLIFTEIGIPYDLDNKHAYKTGDYSSQISAADANHFALEGSQSNGFTWWLYMSQVGSHPSPYKYSLNNGEFLTKNLFQNTHEWGDQRNGEDLSIFSQDDPRSLEEDEDSSAAGLDRASPSFSKSQSTTKIVQVTPENIHDVVQTSHHMSIPSRRLQLQPTASQIALKPDCRASEALVRPSAIYTAGHLLKSEFDLRNCTFTLALRATKAASEEAPTEIFLPTTHFAASQTVISVSSGKFVIQSEDKAPFNVQRLQWWHGQGEQHIKIQGAKRKANKVSPSGMGPDLYSERCQKGSCVVM
jgi:hypothetical protein